MKLYLTSYRIPNIKALFSLFDRPAAELRGLLVMNAKEHYGSQGEAAISSTLKYLYALGFKYVEVFDLRNAALKGESLRKKLHEQDFIYVAGGSGHDIMAAINDTKVAAILKNAIDAGVVYIGESAGAIVLGPSLIGFDSIEAQGDTGSYTGEGLALIDTIIVPHNDSPDEKYAGRAPSIQDQNPGLKVLALNDNQALVTNGDLEQIVSGDDNHSRLAYQKQF